MAQLIGGTVIAAVIFYVSMLQFMISNHIVSVGCLLLGVVVWLSTESLLGGVVVGVLALAGVLSGTITITMVALAAGVWAFVAWGFKH